MSAAVPSNLPVLLPEASGYKGTVVHDEGEIKLTIDCDGRPEQSVLHHASQVIANLQRLDEKCRAYIARASVAAYNQNWRVGVVANPDGSTAPFEREWLNEQGFANLLRLASIGITGDRVTDFWYECGDLYWGHMLYVTAFDGLSFDDLDVQLFG